MSVGPGHSGLDPVFIGTCLQMSIYFCTWTLCVYACVCVCAFIYSICSYVNLKALVCSIGLVCSLSPPPRHWRHSLSTLITIAWLKLFGRAPGPGAFALPLPHTVVGSRGGGKRLVWGGAAVGWRGDGSGRRLLQCTVPGSASLPQAIVWPRWSVKDP